MGPEPPVRDAFTLALSGFVTRWNGGACPPGMGPGSRSGCCGLPNWVLSLRICLEASAWVQGAELKSSLHGCRAALGSLDPMVLQWTPAAKDQVVFLG